MTAQSKSIVFPTDFSGASAEALQWVESLAKDMQATVHCIYVVDRWPPRRGCPSRSGAHLLQGRDDLTGLWAVPTLSPGPRSHPRPGCRRAPRQARRDCMDIPEDGEAHDCQYTNGSPVRPCDAEWLRRSAGARPPRPARKTVGRGALLANDSEQVAAEGRHAPRPESRGFSAELTGREGPAANLLVGGHQTTLEDFDFHTSSKLPAAQIRDLAALRWLHAGESVILYGPVGVGKTHIAGKRWGTWPSAHGADVRFAKTSRVLAELAGGHADGTWAKRLRELARPPVLILDDFGMRELTARQADDLYELINERAAAHSCSPATAHPSTGTPCSPTPSSPSPSSTD